MKVCFETFGCRLNRAEALEDEAKCLAAGHELVTNHRDADFFVVRGCSVTARAQRDCERLIRHLREKYPAKRVYATGCLRNAKPFRVKCPPGEPAVPMRTSRAYLKVQDGCSGKCTFCIVPRFRGDSVSGGFAATLDKAKRFIDAGYREIVVTGCNLSLYADSGKRLPDLIAALAELDPACRIRLGSLEPHLAAGESVAAMAEHANVCRFLHLSVQSGANAVLMNMRRPYTAGDVETLVRRARELMPALMLGCDMIAGFPGETELEHLESGALLTRLKFANVHSFPFSSRPGTPAAGMPAHVDHETVARRARELAKIGETNRNAFARQFLEKEVEVVIEREGERCGWTGEYVWFEEMRSDRNAPMPGNGRRQCLRFRVRKVERGCLYGIRV